MRTYYVYIMASYSRTIYCGLTNELKRRVGEHKFETGSKFTSEHGVNKLVWFESFGSVQEAIAREKQIKGWRRSKKIALIESMNQEWEDLYGAID